MTGLESLVEGNIVQARLDWISQMLYIGLIIHSYQPCLSGPINVTKTLEPLLFQHNFFVFLSKIFLGNIWVTPYLWYKLTYLVFIFVGITCSVFKWYI